MIIIPDKLRRPAEVERDELRAKVQQMQEALGKIVDLRTTACYENALRRDPVYKIARAALAAERVNYETATELYHGINIEIAERLSDYAKEKGVSVGQLSKLLGYSRTYIYQILRGKRNFSMKSLCELMEKTETHLTIKLSKAAK